MAGSPYQVYRRVLQFNEYLDLIYALHHGTMYTSMCVCTCYASILYYSDSRYDVGQFYAAALNDTSPDVYYLNNFNNLLRSYGEGWGEIEIGKKERSTESVTRE